MPLPGRIAHAARDLAPGAFSTVMATGIVSTAAQLLGWEAVSWGLFGVNVALYLVLAALLALRCARFPERVREDFRSHARSAGFLTTVAASAVLGAQLVLRADAPRAALLLWGVSLALWVAIVYGFFAVMTVLPEKPPLDRGINASWMLLVVSTQGVSLLGTLLAPALGVARDPVLAFTTGMFLVGCMLYLLLFSLILYRLLFFPVDAATFGPPYWINMGAVAITTLAGSLLVLRGAGTPVLGALLPFLRGFTLFFWATATWWFPLLLLLGFWRHVLRRVPLEYDLQYWSMVFPLGMYSVATLRLVEALDWRFLLPLPVAVGYVAMGAWAVAAFGLLRGLLRRRPPTGG